MLPAGVSNPLGECAASVRIHDENPHHDLVSGSSVTGLMDLINNTPVDWHSKRQPAVKRIARGSECSAYCAHPDQNAGLRVTL